MHVSEFSNWWLVKPRGPIRRRASIINLKEFLFLIRGQLTIDNIEEIVPNPTRFRTYKSATHCKMCRTRMCDFHSRPHSVFLTFVRVFSNNFFWKIRLYNIDRKMSFRVLDVSFHVCSNRFVLIEISKWCVASDRLTDYRRRSDWPIDYRR